jgi:hypothetical protein
MNNVLKNLIPLFIIASFIGLAVSSITYFAAKVEDCILDCSFGACIPSHTQRGFPLKFYSEGTVTTSTGLNILCTPPSNNFSPAEFFLNSYFWIMIALPVLYGVRRQRGLQYE